MEEKRKRLLEMLELSHNNDRISAVYDSAMIVLIVMSLIPLAFKTETTLLFVLDRVAVCFFVIDYLLRWCTADLKLKRGITSFVLYPFTPMAVIDFVSILPSVTIINGGFRILRVVRMIRALRVFRVFKAFRYSKSIRIIAEVLRKSKESLCAVGTLAIGYILIAALIIFNVEPESFDTFFDAVYWACVSLTTVGYGDIYAVSTVGRIVTMASSFFGIAIVALPAGIITAGYMEALSDEKSVDE